MTGLEAFLLGAVQGLTEFLPVSSSGHLVVFQALLGLHHKGVVFEVVLHVATLVSVLIVYRRRLGELALGTLARDPGALRYVGKLGVATLPAVVAALTVGDWLEAQFEVPAVAGLGLLLTGGLLFTTRYTAPAAHAAEPSWGAALGIGCAQALAILPGVSRSGSTVAAALALGIAPVAAAEFSFLMSIAAVAGAAVRSAPDLAAVPAPLLLPMAIGFATALFAGIGAIWLFVRLLRTGAFHRFAYYAWAVGAGFLLWLAWLAPGAG